MSCFRGMKCVASSTLAMATLLLTLQGCTFGGRHPKPVKDIRTTKQVGRPMQGIGCCDPCGPWVVIGDDEPNITTLCSQCPNGMAKIWTFTMSGVTNGTCTNCNGYNGDVSLIHDGMPGCNWNDNVLTPCNISNQALRYGMRWFPLGTVWELIAHRSDGIPAPIIATWTLPIGSWNCNGPNTLTLMSSDGTCATWPATVTVTPQP
jgi:hypothetical protein